MLKAYRYRLYPTKPQIETLEWTLARCRELYNAALQERRDAYRKCGVNVGYYGQKAALPEIKEARPEYKDIHSQVLQDVIKRLDKSFANFFRRVKQGVEKAGYPRFKGRNRYDSFCYPQYKASVADDARHVYLPKIGNVRIELHRPIEGKIKTATVKRDVDQWYVVLACEVEPKRLEACGNEVGIDLGIASFAATSDGELIDNPCYLEKAQQRLRKAQRRLARRKKGSKRRQKARVLLAKHYRRVRRQRLHFHHKKAREIVNHNDFIAHEDLSVSGMVRSNLARSLLDVGWGQFIGILASKAEEAGRRVVAVHPAYSSQCCSRCGHTDAGNRPSQAVFLCRLCGHHDHADVNAAKNILKWGRAVPSGANVAVVGASVA